MKCKNRLIFQDKMANGLKNLLMDFMKYYLNDLSFLFLFHFILKLYSKCIYFLILLPSWLKFSFSSLYFLVWYFKSNILIGLCCENQILIILIWLFYFLLKCWHHSMSRNEVLCDIFELQFKIYHFWSILYCSQYFVSWSPYLNGFMFLLFGLILFRYMHNGI